MDKPSVPKFGSFKPKPPAIKSLPGQDNSKELLERPPSRRHRKRERSDEDRHHSHGPRDYSRRQRHHEKIRGNPNDSRINARATQTPEPVLDAGSGESDLWLVDRQGDSKNVEYGSMHRYDVPLYQRIGFGRILGAPRNVKIDRDVSTDKATVLRIDGAKRVERMLAAKRNPFTSKTKRIIPELADQTLDFKEDFVALHSSLKRKRGSESPSSDVQAKDYRSVEGKAKPSSRPDDEDLELGSDSDIVNSADAAEAQIRTENAALLVRTKEHPSDVEAWLALVNHQAKVSFPGLDLDRLSFSQRCALANVRLSILDRGLRQVVKGKAGHDRLLLAHISEGAKVREAGKVQREWQKATIEVPESHMVWAGYLSYLQSEHKDFRYEERRDAFQNSLRTLHELYSQAGDGQRHAIAEVIIYVLLRFTILVRGAGYDEQAYGTWQAVLEYQLFAPEYGSTDQKLAAFRDFWDQDAARVGEEGGLGWKHMESGDHKTTRGIVAEPISDMNMGSSLVRFAEDEARLLHTLQLPAAADDDVETDDPFRYVMFSDIQSVLEHVSDHLPEELLVDAFLCFMQLPPAHQDLLETHKWQAESLINASSTSVSSQRNCSYSLFDNAFRSFAEQHVTSESQGNIHPTTRFVSRALERLFVALPDNDLLAEYWLAFKLQLLPREAPKAAKRLLKANPTSLRLYNTYALIQARLYGIEKAREVWSTALGMSGSLNQKAQRDTILLWHSCILTHVHMDNDHAALACILAMPDESAAAMSSAYTNTDVSVARRLRATRYLQARMEELISPNHLFAFLHADCLVWLQYIADGYDVDSALQEFDRLSRQFLQESAGNATELLHQSKARLISLHVDRKRAFKPGLFRVELEKSRKLWPENSVILEQYYRISALTRIDDRLRTAITGTETTATRGLVSWHFAIQDEIQRCNVDGAMSTQSSVRSLFRLALLDQDSKVQHSLLLWRMWLKFELPDRKLSSQSTTLERKRAEETVGRAKQVFYDGLRFLPWCKAWVVEGMKVLHERSGLDEREMRRLYDVLAERELRVRVSVPES